MRRKTFISTLILVSVHNIILTVLLPCLFGEVIKLCQVGLVLRDG